MKQYLSGDRQNGEDILLDVGDVEHEEIGPNPTRNMVTWSNMIQWQSQNQQTCSESC